MKVALSADGKHLHLSSGGWAQTITVEQLPAQIALYRGLRDRRATQPGRPGPYARFYDADVKALEFAQRMIAKRSGQ